MTVTKDMEQNTRARIAKTFEHVDGLGIIWSDNGFIRVEPDGYGKPRFRTWGNGAEILRNTLLASVFCKRTIDVTFPTSVGTARIETESDPRSVSQVTITAYENNDSLGVITRVGFTADQLAAFTALYEEVLAFATAKDEQFGNPRKYRVGMELA